LGRNGKTPEAAAICVGDQAHIAAAWRAQDATVDDALSALDRPRARFGERPHVAALEIE
jgi:hypothetical protein